MNFFFFFRSQSRPTHAAIFVGTASENQLNGNNESPMHVERSEYVLHIVRRDRVHDDPARIFKSVHTKLMSFSRKFLSMILEQNCFEEPREIGQ